MLTYEEMKDKLQNEMKPSRFAHTLGVVESAVALFEKYQDDTLTLEQVKTAALLHDCAKNISEEKLYKIAAAYGISDDPVMMGAPQLLHGPVGAVVAQMDYGIQDGDVLSAIACHTMGRMDMNTLEKIIYLADYIEPGRSCPNVGNLRELAEKDLTLAVVAAMSNTIAYVAGEGLLIHPVTVAARNQLIMALAAGESSESNESNESNE